MSDHGRESIAILCVARASDSPGRLVSTSSDLDGVTITTASTVADALSRLEAQSRPCDGAGTEERNIDCIVCAQSLPDGTGLELLRAVRERDLTLPFVLSPRDGSDRLASEAIGAGVTDYLPRSDDRGAPLERVFDAVTEYQRRQTLVEKSEMLDALMSDLPLSIYFKDRDGRNVRVSKTAARGSWADPVGKTDLELAPDEVEDSARESYEDDMRVVETGEPLLDKEEKYQFNDDGIDTIWQRTSKIPWRDDDGRIKGLIGVTRDITELKVRERELEQQKQRLDRFASFASHDLRNPLNIAHGYLEYARETGEESALIEVEDAIERMDDLIDDLLTTARSDIELPSIEQISLGTFVELVWANVANEAATCQTSVPDGTILRADEPQLRQLLENLFKNAIDHAGSDVEVIVGATETGFFVADDGPGIPDSKRDSVLEYGYTDADGGTGIGLAIVNQVVDAHDWTVSISESSTGGTRFDVENCLMVTEPLPVGDEGRTVELTEATDVGNATPPGTSRYVADRDEWIVRGGGENVWHTIDECYVVSTRVDGDARIVGRIVDFDPVAEHSKAGLVVRAGTDSGTPLGFVGRVDDGRSELLWRPTEERSIVSRELEAETATPYWYRIDRFGTQLTWYHSADGETWTPVDQRRIESAETVSVGLLVCSLHPERSATGVFDNVTVSEL